MPAAGSAGRVRDRGRMSPKRRVPRVLPVPLDVLVARLATTQSGVVARKQLLTLGALGPGATLSHRTALAIHKLIPSMPQLIEVTLTNRVPRHREGILVHQATAIEVTTIDGLPVTTPAQTLKDVPDRRVTAEALYRGLIDRTQTEAEPTWQGHGHWAAFHDDRARDAHLQALGYKVLRFTCRSR